MGRRNENEVHFIVMCKEGRGEERRGDAFDAADFEIPFSLPSL